MRKALLMSACLAVICLLGTIPSASQHPPDETMERLQAPPGLELTLWASEPQVLNPTNLDIDEKGRLWVTEAVNYRRQLRNEPDYREQGDRITILEDSDGDGRADRTKVFLQDPSLRSPLGIAVLGNQVIVSQSPDILVFTKDDQDRIVDRQVLLTGWGGEDHDHGVHAVVYGFDGRFYFNNGDSGLDVTDRSGRRIASGPSELYYGGSALRMNLDGTGLEVLGHNFRNPYELALDSFGNIWQSDNDDDGNEWVRINYVMEGGNHGYWGPGGRKWREDRGTHFHEEDPGVVPTLLRTGAGSPCGLLVYEGRLLPAEYWGRLLHVDNGPRVLRRYDVRPLGAGFRAEMKTVIDGSDTWFRPSDLVVGHDGSLFVADWYDAVVGGHQMRDSERGRIYRLVPARHRTRHWSGDLSTPAARAEALASPSQSVRYRADRLFREQGAAAVPELKKLLAQGSEILRARALWLLGAAGPDGLEEVLELRRDQDERFRVLAVRILKQNHPDFLTAVEPLVLDPSSQVRREVAIGLRDLEDDRAVRTLVTLARFFNPRDRWYLEALHIGAQGKIDQTYAALKDTLRGDWSGNLGRLAWVLRPAAAVADLKESALDESESTASRLAAVRALGVQPDPAAGLFLAGLVRPGIPEPIQEGAAAAVVKQLFSQWMDLRQKPEIRAVVLQALGFPNTRVRALDLIGDLQDPSYAAAVAEVVRSKALSQELRAVALEILGRLPSPSAAELTEELLASGPPLLRLAAVRALANSRDPGASDRLVQIIQSEAENELRSEAVRALGSSRPGLIRLLDLAESGRLPEELKSTTTMVVHGTRDEAILQRAERVLPMFTTGGEEILQSPRSFLLRVQGRPEEGRQVFSNLCASCHNVEPAAEKLGPDLSRIGDKLGKEGLLEAVLNPSGGISHEYVTWVLTLKSGQELRGMIASETGRELVIRDFSGQKKGVASSEVVSRRRDPVSAMPNLIGIMSEQDLGDLIAYMETLRH